MFEYIIKRILIFIPTLFIISLVAFSLSKLAPGDPVELITKGGGGQDSGQMADMMATERAYQETAERLGMHLPNFYFSLSSASMPDTLHKVVKHSEREMLSTLISKYGNWPQISDYFLALKNLEKKLQRKIFIIFCRSCKNLFPVIFFFSILFKVGFNHLDFAGSPDVTQEKLTGFVAT